MDSNTAYVVIVAVGLIFVLVLAWMNERLER